MAENVLSSDFSCPNSLPSRAVVYRSNMRGIDADGCSNLALSLGETVRANPVLSVLGNQLNLITNCEVSVPSMSEFNMCDLQDGDESSIAVIAGGVSGGAIAAVIVLAMCVVILVALKKRQGRQPKRNSIELA